MSKDLAPNLIATARDVRDGTIEAYESKHGAPILGIQWHPETSSRKKVKVVCCSIIW